MSRTQLVSTQSRLFFADALVTPHWFGSSPLGVHYTSSSNFFITSPRLAESTPVNFTPESACHFAIKSPITEHPRSLAGPTFMGLILIQSYLHGHLCLRTASSQGPRPLLLHDAGRLLDNWQAYRGDRLLVSGETVRHERLVDSAAREPSILMSYDLEVEP
ncbi:hypothetical protein BJY01DRAFT_149409 [Aspergillus pseudoustus]|uniref:Uncharacterized protein n=1 Tax=Aspergillus pseudoustus TaxID=1810923 RepID=A0ABR4KA39_9EURO